MLDLHLETLLKKKAALEGSKGSKSSYKISESCEKLFDIKNKVTKNISLFISI